MPFRAAVIMVLTFVFGIVPATLLVSWAVILGLAAVFGVFQFGDPGVASRGLLAATAAVLSVYGYVALFHAAGDVLTPKVARWLACGIGADLIGVGFVSSEPEWLALNDWFIFVSPALVGSAHLARFLARLRRLPARSRR